VVGTLLAFVVADVDAEFDRLQNKGPDVVLPLVTEPWGNAASRSPARMGC
jgi:uncharacterized glyoxalase superfamily protein PhnB